jgi:hypothetical protein
MYHELFTYLHSLPKFDCFITASFDETSKLIDESNRTYCDPSSLIKRCNFHQRPAITNIINLSLGFGVHPINLNLAQFVLSVRLITDLYISHLSLLSRLTERKVKNRLTNFISKTYLPNSSQSAYTKYQSN